MQTHHSKVLTAYPTFITVNQDKERAYIQVKVTMNLLEGDLKLIIRFPKNFLNQHILKH